MGEVQLPPLQGQHMADNSSIPQSPTPHEMTHHVRDYDHFLTLFKWGAAISLLTGFIVVVFVL